MERNQESKPRKDKIYSGGGGVSERIFEIWKSIWPIILTFVVLMGFSHLILFLIYADPEEIDKLDYCKFIYGSGWEIYLLSQSTHVCKFTQENGSVKLVAITKENVESRHCKRKFYNPFYCGR